MPFKAVIHVDQEDAQVLTTALGNIRNFLEQAGTGHDVRMVVNHRAAAFFVETHPGAPVDPVPVLAAKGVRFLICNNSLASLGIEASRLLEACEVVPAGIVEIVRLQHEGFAYVKP